VTTSIVVAAYDSSLLSERGGVLTDSSLESVVSYILMLDLKGSSLSWQILSGALEQSSRVSLLVIRVL
jgi:hypothetical protein